MQFRVHGNYDWQYNDQWFIKVYNRLSTALPYDNPKQSISSCDHWQAGRAVFGMTRRNQVNKWQISVYETGN
jgi:hypothetical protein